MVPDIVIAAFVALLIGMVAGCVIYYYTGEPKCKHQFEEVLRVDGGGKYVVAHMCKKCGKRKITRV
jgi:hypothetical protein